jgi:hypothetical protein
VLIGADPVPVPVGAQEGFLGEVLGPHAAARQGIGERYHLRVLLQIEVLKAPRKPDPLRLTVPRSAGAAVGGSPYRHPAPSNNFNR